MLVAVVDLGIVIIIIIIIVISSVSFFLSWVSETQPNHWTKRIVGTGLTT